MKTRGNLMIMMAVALLTAGCQKDELVATTEELVPIQLSTSINMDMEAETRAFTSTTGSAANYTLQNVHFLPASGSVVVSGTTLVTIANNSIAVYVEDKGTDSPETTYTAAQSYVPNGTDGLTTSPIQYYPSNNGNVGIYAYYPRQSSDLVPATARARTTGVISFPVQADQTTLANYALSDLMYAKVENQVRQKTAVNLPFKHLLSKVTVEIRSDGHFQASHLEGADVDIKNTKTNAKFNFNTGAIEEYSSGSGNYYYNETTNDIRIITDLVHNSITTSSGQTGSCIIVPQKVAAGTEFIKITLTNGGTYSFKVPTGGYTFEPQKAYKFVVTLTNTAITLTATITSWGEETTYSSLTALQP